MSRESSEIKAFLTDMAMFFYGRSINYVDVGAYDGETFREVCDSALKVGEALLIEPSPAAYATLEQTASQCFKGGSLSLRHLAAGAQRSEVSLKPAQGVSRIVDSDAAEFAEKDSEVCTVASVPLDDLVDCFSEQHISILKIDEEGSELKVLEGAEKILAGQSVDVIYIGAGWDSRSRQQTFHRLIDDFLVDKGYHLYRIYEQKHDWTQDSPLLRRVNMAYMSEAFAAANPYHLTSELSELKERLEYAEEVVRANKLRISGLASKLEKAEGRLRHMQEAAEQKAGEAQRLAEENQRTVELANRQADVERERADKAEQDIRRLRHAEEAAEQKAGEAQRQADVERERADRAEQDIRRLRHDLDATLEHLSQVAREMVGEQFVDVDGDTADDDSPNRLSRLRGLIEVLQNAGSSAQLTLVSERALRERLTGEYQAKSSALEASEQHSAELTARLGRAREVSEKRKQERDALSEEVRALTYELAFTHHTLGHRVGAAIVKNAHPLKIWKTPLSVVQAVRHYRRDKPKEALRRSKYESSTQQAPQVSPQIQQTPQHDWPKPKKYSLMWQAQQIAESQGFESACTFVRVHGDEDHQLALSLLQSNLYDLDDQRWLAEVNHYLSQFHVAPIRLVPGSGRRFSRLSTDLLPAVSDGPLITVIMPAYNAAETLELSVRSILNQTWKNLELIIVNDCSSDSTSAIANAIAESDTRVRVLENKENVGPYVSKNRALDAARGEFITGHDADDWAHPQRLQQQVAEMFNHPQWQVSIAYMLRMSESGNFLHFSKVGKTSPDGALRLASISCFFRREFLKDVLGHWDCVRFGADSEMIERCRTILGDEEFGTARLMSMICLDAENSLTNHPVHGISKQTGISPTRKYYRDQWTAWHEGLSSKDAYMAFPEVERKFAVPAEAEVPLDTMARLLGREL